ncbi:MarR family winged helix-turn-helix transcriptional regulator [Desertibacillus haloalkaliphilus]|uniref:MarR family winged helix-turn-helix transcriptional regulator n=1 Tax=Desertibacillus haloalkaliphilus TaxID=1328930 RepID=UPI001C252B15|nr:MarR family transcriptional regulator [Desertibacillus haloalkaliphilus]MBU8906652.1 MarR family transcriptional regulator [Desertibacillus haloalkaliphilus]
MDRNIEQSVGYQLGIVSHFIQNSYNQKLSEFNITVSQAKVLYFLVEHGNQFQSELQNRLYIKASSMNGIIETMRKKGLIEKVDSREDRRSKVIELTEAGRTMEARLWDELRTIEEELVRGFSVEEKQLVLAWLKKMQKNMRDQ